MPLTSVFALYLAAALTLGAALLHFACVFVGAKAFRLLGAGAALTRMAQQKHWYPNLIAIAIGLALSLLAAYAFCAARGAPTLPWTQPLLTILAAVLLLRGLAFPLLKSRFDGNSDLFWYLSSGLCLTLGSLYAVGVYALP